MKNAVTLDDTQTKMTYSKESNYLMKQYQLLLTEYGKMPYLYATLGIIGQSCIGSIAVMFLFMNEDSARYAQMIELFFITILCMGFNGTVLSQQSHKMQLNFLIASVIVSVVCVVINLV